MLNAGNYRHLAPMDRVVPRITHYSSHNTRVYCVYLTISVMLLWSLFRGPLPDIGLWEWRQTIYMTTTMFTRVKVTLVYYQQMILSLPAFHCNLKWCVDCNACNFPDVIGNGIIMMMSWYGSTVKVSVPFVCKTQTRFWGLSWAPSQYKDRLIYVWGFPC